MSKTYALPDDMHEWIEERARERATNRSVILAELLEFAIGTETQDAQASKGNGTKDAGPR